MVGDGMVAAGYTRMGRYNARCSARANTVRLLGASADREADLGEAMVAAGISIVAADAKASFERALKIDPNHLKAQYFIGLAAEQDGRPEQAAQIWRAMLARAPANAPFRPLVQQSRGARRQERAAEGHRSRTRAAAADQHRRIWRLPSN